MYRVNRNQRGAVIVTTALTLLFLLGFMGVALDLGRLFIVKSELQTAMDSCALAAAQELDRSPNSIQRAQSAGRIAGNLNAVDLQSASWRDRGQITDADITFRDAEYGVTSDPATARYAQCEFTHTGIQMWLLHTLGAFSGATETYPGTQNVLARAVATRASAQTTCPIPVAIRPRAGGSAPNYGFDPGEWVTLLTAQGAVPGGHIGWANLDGSNSAAQTVRELEEDCARGIAVDDPLGTPGTQTAVADVWNARFGIYRNSGDPSNYSQRPDFTGYAYTLNNWPSGRNAYNDPVPPPGAHPTAQNYVTKRQAFASCADTGTNIRGGDSCQSITGRNLNSFQRLAAPGNVDGGHRQYGSNRRVVLVPVINSASRVEDFACMLMLQPLSIPMANVQLEFIGNASDPASPCTASGMPGGSGGPLVPVLVQ